MWKTFAIVVLCALLPAALPSGVDRRSSPMDQGRDTSSEVLQRRGSAASSNSVFAQEQQVHEHVTFGTTTDAQSSPSWSCEQKPNDDGVVPCGGYHNCNSSQAKCDFIDANPDCANDDGFIDYLSVIYCNFGSLRGLGFVILALWLVYLLIALGVTAEEFFCPDLDVMSRTLKMSQNIAGVTLLAFGNGAPDIFSAIAAITSSRNGEAGLAIGALFGAGIFVTTVVAGSIAVTKPFKMAERPFLRDSIFYLVAAFWTFVVLYRGSISLFEAVGYIALYGAYVILVFVGRKVYQRRKRKRLERETKALNGNQPSFSRPTGPELEDPNTFHPSSINSTHVSSINSPPGDTVAIGNSINGPVHRRGDLSATQRLVVAASMMGVDETVVRSLTPQPHVSGPSDDDERQPLLGDSDEEHPRGQVKEFFVGLCPIDIEGWKEKAWYSKVIEIIKSPLILFLKATIPVVDYNEPKHNWNRLLNVFNVITGPLFCAIATKGFTKTIAGGFQVWHLILIVSVIVAAIVFFTSKQDTQPVYHWVFSYMGFVVAVLWIYSTANEIVNILQMFGIEFAINDAVLGLTVLAWGNSIGDLVADVTMAKQGFPTMGMSACFGGPMFNMLMGIGIACTIVTIRDGKRFQLKTSNVQFILALGLAISLLSSMFIMLFTRFQAKRWYGIYLFVLYGVFLSIALLVEVGVIPW